MTNQSNMISSTTFSLEQMLVEMDQALSEEIEKLSTFRQVKYSAVDGRLLSEENGRYIYQFTLLEPWEPQDDTPLTIANGEVQGMQCTVVNSTGTLITIASEIQLPPDVLRKIDLSDDATQLLKRLKDALKHVDEGNAKLGSKCFDLLPYRESISSEEVIFGKHQPHTNQKRAVQMALGGEVTFIVGPPGTGKTSTLAAIAFKHLQAGRTVLVAAHTNIAIDNAIMQLNDFCKDTNNDGLLAHGQVVRYGAVQKDELKCDDTYKEVYLPKIAKSLGNELLQQHEQLKASVVNLDLKLNTIRQQQQAEETRRQAEYEDLKAQVYVLQNELAPLEQTERQRISTLQVRKNQFLAHLLQLAYEEKLASQELARAKAQIEEKKVALDTNRQNEQILLAQLVDARTMNGLKRFFRGIKLEHLEMHVASTSQAVYEAEQHLIGLQTNLEGKHTILAQCKQTRQSCEAAINTITAQLSTPSEEANKIQSLKDRIRRPLGRLSQIETLRNQEKQLYQQEYQTITTQRSQLAERIAGIDKQLRDIEKSIVENARVVGTTLTKTYMNQAITGRRFDAVILDEVSMAPLPLVYVAASHAGSSVTLIGDPQQLSPIVSADTPMAKTWLGEDLFFRRKISLEKAISGYRHSVMLDTQSRMHPDISVIANRHVYDNLLKDAFNIEKLKSIEPLQAHPLVLCDTYDASPTVTRPSNGRSRLNYYHALCSIALAKHALVSAPELKQKSERSIGIVTPYRPQAQLLQRMIKDAGLATQVQASTVHRFQGLEFDVVIFDTVESPGLKPGEFISGAEGSSSMRLINVAVTRPKQKLFIVANHHHIQQELPKNSTLHLAVKEASKSAVIHSLDIVGTPFSALMEKVHRPKASLQDALATLDSQGELLVLQSAKKAKRDEANVVGPARHESKDEADIKHYTEQDFYDVLKRDLQRARTSIMIASPYLAEARINDILPLLIERKRGGVDVKIYTKPLNESAQWDVRATDGVKSAGIEPVYRSKMHEKMIIIDETVLYHGSLNSLSQRDSLESMLRIKEHNIIKEVIASITSNRQQQSLPIVNDEMIKSLKEIVIFVKDLPPAMTTCTCGSVLVPRLRKKDAGVFYGCLQFANCEHRKTENISLAHLQQIKQLQNYTCSQCGGLMSLHLQDKTQRVLLVCNTNCGEMQKITFTR